MILYEVHYKSTRIKTQKKINSYESHGLGIYLKMSPSKHIRRICHKDFIFYLFFLIQNQSVYEQFATCI